MNIYRRTILFFAAGSLSCPSVAFRPATTRLAPPSSPSSAFQPFLHRHEPKREQRRPMSRLYSFPVDGMGTVLNDFVASQPYIAAFLTCSVKASAADLLAQTQQQQQQQQQQGSRTALTDDNTPAPSSSSSSLLQFDRTRNLAFLFYGGLMQGCFQNYIFSNVYPAWFGTSVAPQVLFDITVMGPCVFIPMCYSLKSIFARAATSNTVGASPEIMTVEWLLEAIQGGLAKYYEDVTQRGLLRQFWSIWLPAQCLTFGVVPTHFRVIFVALVSFFWVCLLSII